MGENDLLEKIFAKLTSIDERLGEIEEILEVGKDVEIWEGECQKCGRLHTGGVCIRNPQEYEMEDDKVRMSMYLEEDGC